MKYIVLTNGESAIVDDDDYESVSSFKWAVTFLNGKKYVRATTHKNGSILLHRFILKPPKEQIIDHKSGDTLDNRRSNLRFATHQQNIQNRRKNKNSKAPYKGIEKRRNGRWSARVQRKSLGTFDTPEGAAHAYDKKALEIFGEFAKLNFPVVLP